MAMITFEGHPIETVGELPKVGDIAPDFVGVKQNLSDASLRDYRGKKVILNIFPSVDTPVCALSLRAFNSALNSLKTIKVLCISLDMPMASRRFCLTDNLENVETLSMFRNPDFGKLYGVTIKDGVLRGMYSRAVVVLDETGNVIYTEQVKEVSNQPDYEKALAAAKK